MQKIQKKDLKKKADLTKKSNFLELMRQYIHMMRAWAELGQNRKNEACNKVLYDWLRVNTRNEYYVFKNRLPPS